MNKCVIFDHLIKNIQYNNFFLMGFIVILHLFLSNFDNVIYIYNLSCLLFSIIHKFENKSNLGIFTMYIALAIIMRNAWKQNLGTFKQNSLHYTNLGWSCIRIPKHWNNQNWGMIFPIKFLWGFILENWCIMCGTYQLKLLIHHTLHLQQHIKYKTLIDHDKSWWRLLIKRCLLIKINYFSHKYNHFE
jgi:hypothetical protein